MVSLARLLQKCGRWEGLASGGRLRKNIYLTGHQVHGVAFKKRAPRAIKEIRAFASKAMVCDNTIATTA